MSGHTIGTVVVESLFAYGLMATIAMATAGFIAALVAGLGVVDRRRQAAEARARPPAHPPAAVVSPPPEPVPAAMPAMPDHGVDPAIVAVIAAAVQAVIGAHRIVYIGEAAPGERWVGETRARQHGHEPHREH